MHQTQDWNLWILFFGEIKSKWPGNDNSTFKFHNYCALFLVKPYFHYRAIKDGESIERILYNSGVAINLNLLARLVWKMQFLQTKLQPTFVPANTIPSPIATRLCTCFQLFILTHLTPEQEFQSPSNHLPEEKSTVD